VIALFAVDVEHELDERQLQARAVAFHELVPAAGDLRAALEVEDVERLAEVVVRDDGLGELPAVLEPPPVARLVVGLVRARRHALVGNVRDLQQAFLELGLEFVRALLDGLQLLLE